MVSSTRRSSPFLQEQAGAVPDCAPTETDRCLAAADTSLSDHPSRGLFRIDTRTGIFDLWQPNTAALTGLHDVWGVSNPLVLVHWHTLWENNGGRHTRIYDLLNVLYVLVRDGTPLPEQYTLAYDAPGPLAVYENPDPLPRAWLVSAAQILPDEEAVLTALQQPSFEPLHTVVLMQNDGSPTETRVRRPVVAVEHGARLSRSSSYGENEIVLATSAERPGYLVLSEVWYPGWRATVNG